MREARQSMEVALRKKQARIVEEMEVPKEPSIWRAGVVTKSLKFRGARPRQSCSGRRRPDKWDPPDNLFPG
jgi:hypothetical protein